MEFMKVHKFTKLIQFPKIDSYFSYQKNTRQINTSSQKQSRTIMLQFTLLLLPLLIGIIAFWTKDLAGLKSRQSELTVLIFMFLNSVINPYCYLIFSRTMRKYVNLGGKSSSIVPATLFQRTNTNVKWQFILSLITSIKPTNRNFDWFIANKSKNYAFAVLTINVLFWVKSKSFANMITVNRT